MIKLLASLPHGGGLLYIGFSLFHQKAVIREHTVNLFNQLRAYPVSAYVYPIWLRANGSILLGGRGAVFASVKSLSTVCIRASSSCERAAGTMATAAAASSVCRERTLNGQYDECSIPFKFGCKQCGQRGVLMSIVGNCKSGRKTWVLPFVISVEDMYCISM
jgi:hypothetical protein